MTRTVKHLSKTGGRNCCCDNDNKDEEDFTYLNNVNNLSVNLLSDLIKANVAYFFKGRSISLPVIGADRIQFQT